MGCVTMARAEPIPPPNLPDIVHASDVIVVGRALAKHFDNPPDVASDFIVQTKLMLRGNSLLKTIYVKAAPQFGAQDPEIDDITQSAQASVKTDEFGMFFLKLSRDGSYYATNIYYPSIPANADGAIFHTSGPNAWSQIAMSLADNFALSLNQRSQPDVSPARRYWGVRGEVRGEEIFQFTYDLFSDVPNDAALKALNYVLERTVDPTCRAWIISTLMKKGDFSHLSELRHAAVSNHIDGFPYNELYNVLTSEYHPPPGITEVMVVFLHSREPLLRAAGADALRNIGTRAAVIPLADAINDPDPRVREYAVSGLCRYSHACTGQVIFDYARPENTSAFLAFLRGQGLEK